jgi:formimidoylglutamate deiminase
MQWERPNALFARKALTSQGWQRDVLIGIGSDGTIAGIEKAAKAPPGAPVFDLVLPGMANVHSHAFQRAMAGLTEITSGKGRDNFWSWRETMYGFTRKLTPEHIEAIARALYIDLLKHGYTAVGEFHYVHHDGNGKPYASITELSDRIVAGAQATGIHLTHLPVMYETGNFGGAAANDGQKRFVHNADSYLQLVEALVKKYGKADGITLGIAPHSLRAVTPQTLQRILEALPGLDLADCPIHMHIAEQEKEVEDCIGWSKQRPAEWLFDHHQVDKHWCLIHATHTTSDEVIRMAKNGATVGLCPTTEANLGDGIFPAEQYLKVQGSFGIGSDSNVCVSPWEELRLMEYAQRLITRKRTVLCSEATPSVGRTLFAQAAGGGAKALGIRAGEIAPGRRADMMVLSTNHALLAEKDGDAILDTLLFAVTPAITDVFVAGKRVVTNGRHALEEESAQQLRAITRLC